MYRPRRVRSVSPRGACGPFVGDATTACACEAVTVTLSGDELDYHTSKASVLLNFTFNNRHVYQSTGGGQYLYHGGSSGTSPYWLVSSDSFAYGRDEILAVLN